MAMTSVGDKSRSKAGNTLLELPAVGGWGQGRHVGDDQGNRQTPPELRTAVPALPTWLIEPVWDQLAALLPEHHDTHPLGCHRPHLL
jgi:hypothetical protein